jgi:predicted dehydrogenase
MSRDALRVGIVGCGLIGGKRADALGAQDELVGCTDASAEAAIRFAAERRTRAFATLDQLLDCQPDVMIVAVSHDSLAPLTGRALEAGAHVLVEKPAGLGVAQIERLAALERATDRRVKVGFNHRFHGGLQRTAAEVHSGAHGALMHVRGRYGHGGRIGYDREWRADPLRSGGGELVDQGMHLLDLTHWIAGPLPLHSALLRTQFWDAEVEDNAALLLGDAGSRDAAWATLHVSWTEWKNLFSLEVYCHTAKLHVEGLARSYGPQRLKIHRMRRELGPPETEEIDFPSEDSSWAAEWEHFASALSAADGRPLSGDLDAARYAWSQVEAAYALSPPFAAMREAVER